MRDVQDIKRVGGDWKMFDEQFKCECQSTRFVIASLTILCNQRPGVVSGLKMNDFENRENISDEELYKITTLHHKTGHIVKLYEIYFFGSTTIPHW